MAPEVAMVGAVSGQALVWIRKGVKLLGASGFQRAYDEFRREDQVIFQMLTAPAPIQPDPQVLVQQLNESSADQHGGSSAYQTAREIMADLGRSGIECQRLSQMNILSMGCRAVIDSLHRISTSRNRYLEKDVEVIFHDRFLVHAIARDPHAARQIHEAIGVRLPTL
jgi:hypothetical protein